jgi:hypothetical protein
MKRTACITCGLVLLLTLGACVAGSVESHHAAAGGEWQQFLLGLWHGIIAPVTLIIEIVNRLAPHALPWRVRLYEAADTGVAYDVGFYLGLAGAPSTVFGTWRRR